MSTLNRRDFLASTGVAALALGAASAQGQPGTAPPPQPGARPAHWEGEDHRGPCVISSGNGLATVQRAWDLMAAGTYPLDAIVEGVKIVEDDPKDNSVGYGGLPNEDGIVELDASVMDGPLHRAGAVGALRNIKNPAAVALQVLRKTDHVMIVGEGALRFAKAMGFQETDLLTPESKAAWERWKNDPRHESKWLSTEEQITAPSGPSKPHGRGGDGAPAWPHDVVPHTTGTIHASALGSDGTLAACTTTSGLSWKIPGRLGDSPIVGAGMYCDNAVGSAGSTGRGESVIQVCGSFAVVELMARGLSPTEACLELLKRIVDRTREKRLLKAAGNPKFEVTMYALRKDGAFGAASLHASSKARFTVHDGKEARPVECAYLLES
jgi:N4-(beta-N-acetylglucosaminyl)-L-asparaginase